MMWSVFLLSLMIMRCLSQTMEPSTCNSCCQGPIGPQGPPGIPGVGIHGSHGTNGIPGAVGQKGESGVGVRGEPGVRGDPGVRCESGQKGERGEGGIRGLPGKVGPVGPRGLTGLGEAGPQGLAGMKGERGFPGQSAVTRRSAFTAVKTGPQIGSLNEVVLFTQLVTDIGNDYATSTGKFTCRVPGVYIFMFSVNTGSSEYDTAVGLVKNNVTLVGAFIDKQGRRPWYPDDQIGNGAVAHLVAGDQVWLKFITSTGKVSTINRSFRLASFSGILMYAD